MLVKKYLFEKVFEKAKTESGKQSKNGMSNHLERVISDDFNYSITSKSFSRYYEDFIQEKNLQKDINPDLLNILAQYINHDSYADFAHDFKQNEINPIFKDVKVDPITPKYEVLIQPENNKKSLQPKKLYHKKNIVMGAIASVLVGGSFMYNQIDTNDNCMIWKENHYEEIDCSETNSNMIAKPFNDEIFRLQKITRIDTLSLDNTIGKVWYNKSNGELEFFTNYGLHPENGKTLKPVTEYIMNKYVINK